LKQKYSKKFKIALLLLVVSLMCNYYLYKEIKIRTHDLVNSQFENFYLSVSNTLAVLEGKYEKPTTMILFNYQANPPFRLYKSLNMGGSTEYVLKEYQGILKDLNYDKYQEKRKLVNNFNKIFELLTPLASTNKLTTQKMEIIMKKIKPLINEITLSH